MTYTDGIVIAILTIMGASGATRGFVRSLIGPAALLLSIGISWVWYQLTASYLISLLISIIAPFILSRIAEEILKLWTPPDGRPRISLLDRIGGQMLALVFGGAVVLLSIALLGIIPLERWELGNANKDIKGSYTFSLVRPTLIKNGLLSDAPIKKDCPDNLCSMDEGQLASIADEKEIQAFLADPRIQKIMLDPEIQKAAAERNFLKILSHPVIKDLSSDPAFMARALKLFPKIQAQSFAQDKKE